MGTVIKFLLCSFVVVIATDEVKLEPDQPFLTAMASDTAVLKCCYSYSKGDLNTDWVKGAQGANGNWTRLAVTSSDGMSMTSDTDKQDKNKHCGTLTFESVTPNESGMYQCLLNSSTVNLFTHGTYLHVYKPRKTINLSENTKNKILTAEGILLFLCVVLPSVSLLCQSRRLNELEKKKVRREEENIYQGLNLDDCCATYDQIERSQGHGPYQDVCNIMEEEEEIQLEKP